MSKNVNHIQHIKSNVVENGKPKLPLASALVEGELAVNYAEGYETISLKNSSGDIVTFSSDEYYTSGKLGSGFTGENSAKTVTEIIEENEEITSAALNDLDERKLDSTAYTPTDLSNYYTKDETSGATEIATALDGKQDVSGMSAYTLVVDFEDKLGSGFTGENSGVTVTKYLEENEKVTAAALNDLETNKLDASAYTPTDLSNYYTKSETSGATEISTALDSKQDVSGMSAYTTSEVLDNKLGSGFTGENSANTVTSIIEENEEIISAALNDLEANKLDASAYTPTDLSNYYTKSQTSGATEISTALGAKVNSQTFISHTGDSVVHVTNEERTTWNAKADKTWVEDKLGSAFTGANSAVTVTKYLEENEMVTSAALNDLEANKLDASAYTPTDLSNYYTKSQTSGATEISTALGTKENTLAVDSTAKTSSFSAEAGKYYFVNVPNDGSVIVTLPTSNMSSTNVQSIVFLVTLGTGTASIAFTPIAFKTEGFNDMTAGNTYEVNALWNGTNWIMAMTKLEAVV